MAPGRRAGPGDLLLQKERNEECMQELGNGVSRRGSGAVNSQREQEVGAEVPVPRGPGRKPVVAGGALGDGGQPDPTGTVFSRRESGSILEGSRSESFAGGLKEGLTPGNSC